MEPVPFLLGVFFVAAGCFALCGAGCDWDWFMTHRKARFFSALLTRTGARFFYGLLGLGLAVLGALMLAGVLPAGK